MGLRECAFCPQDDLAVVVIVHVRLTILTSLYRHALKGRSRVLSCDEQMPAREPLADNICQKKVALCRRLALAPRGCLAT
jgi:hypothetical protein